MNEDNTNSAGQADDAPIASESAAPKETVSNVAADTLSLKEINEFLGKNYKDKSTALKSFKDTFSYVGRKVEAAKPAETNDGEVTRQLRELKTELFYSKNPQYDSAEMRAVISKMGENPADVVATQEFKTIFEKVNNYDKIQKTKTVLESNPRIGQVRNKMSEAKQATQERDYTKGKNLAVASVLEAYELQ